MIYDRKIAYSETRLLYIGLFSRTPNNVFASNYTELLQELIDKLSEHEVYEDEIFETLFLLQGISQESLQEAKNIFSHPSYASMFDRLYKEDSLSYRCLLSILALCGAVNINIAERNADIEKEYNRVKSFLMKSREILKGQQDRFLRFHKMAIKIWMQELLVDEDETKVRRDMYISSKTLNFTNMFRKLCIEADLDSLNAS